MLLKGKRKTAEGDRSCYLLELTETGSSGVQFKLLPRYKYRQEGDSVMYSDLLLIVNVKLGVSSRRRWEEFQIISVVARMPFVYSQHNCPLGAKTYSHHSA